MKTENHCYTERRAPRSDGGAPWCGRHAQYFDRCPLTPTSRALELVELCNAIDRAIQLYDPPQRLALGSFLHGASNRLGVTPAPAAVPIDEDPRLAVSIGDVGQAAIVHRTSGRRFVAHRLFEIGNSERRPETPAPRRFRLTETPYPLEDQVDRGYFDSLEECGAQVLALCGDHPRPLGVPTGEAMARKTAAVELEGADQAEDGAAVVDFTVDGLPTIEHDHERGVECGFSCPADAWAHDSSGPALIVYPTAGRPPRPPVRGPGALLSSAQVKPTANLAELLAGAGMTADADPVRPMVEWEGPTCVTCGRPVKSATGCGWCAAAAS